MNILIFISKLFNVGDNVIESKNTTKLTDFFQSKSLVLLTIYSSIFISFPAIFKKFGLFIIGISILIITVYLFKEFRKRKEINIFQYILLIYGFWIILASVIHYIGLSKLEPLTYITVKRQNVSWGLLTLKDTTLIYLFFPLLYLIALYLLQPVRDGYKILYFLPIFIIPSLVLAIYQGFIDIEFLNNPFSAKYHRTSGFGTDANEFGLSLFLLFPLCILAVLLSRNLWKKVLFALLSAVLFWCLLLSGTRTGFVGVAIFMILLPWIWVWANNNLSKKVRYILLSSPLIFILVIGIIGVKALKGDYSSSLILIRRLNTTLSEYKEGGIKKVIQKSGRLDLGLQAYRLTELSPLAGWGPGGFFRNLNNIRFRNGEGDTKYYFHLFDNANNQYLQMSSELGLLGAFFNLFLHLLPLWMVFRIRKRIRARNERCVVGVVFVTVSVMMLLFITGPHTMAAGVLWIFVVLLSFLFITASRYGYLFSQVRMKIFTSSLLILTVLFLGGTYTNVFGKNGYEAMQQADWWPLKYGKNCYPSEQWREGVVVWCNKEAFVQIPLYKRLPYQTKLLSFSVHHPDVGVRPVKVKYGGKSGPVHEIVFKDHSWYTIEVPVTEDNIFEFADSNKTSIRYFILSLDVSRTWVPKEWGVNDDTRELGVAVLIIRSHKKE